MATNYPSGIDSLTNPSAGDALTSPSHSAQHANANDAIEAIETELGTTPSGSETTVAARLTAIESGARMGTGSIGATALADNAVDTAAIADGAVTSAKIADGTITATDVAASTFAAFGTVGNLLTANQASVETDSSPFGAFLNCTISRSTAHSVHGSACLKAVATADGPFIAGLDVESFPVVPGETITATFALKADREIVGVRVTIQWATGGSPGDLVYRTVTATTSWVTHSLTVVVPSGVETAGLFSWVTIHAAAGSEIYMDCFGVWKGAGGQWAMPGTPIPGGSHIAVNGAVHLSGTGTPEGVVTAAPGSTWLQTDSTTDVKGWIRWVKASGTGNTGWVAGPEADTGWRSLDATAFGVDTGKLTLGKCHLRRVGPQVFLSFYGAKVGTSGATIAVVPAGFRPADADDTYAQVRNFTSKLDAGISNVNTVGQINWDSAGLTDGNFYIVTCTFAVTAAWPSSLPGSAA